MKNQVPTKDSDKKNYTPDEQLIDETLEETFPASDPPSWYAGKDTEKKKDK